MTDLARRRRARDLWISPGHLGAAACGAVLLGLTAFSAGVLVGRGARVEVSEARWGEPADGALVALLARVEATAHRGGGVDALTFPDALRRDGGPEVKIPEVQRVDDVIEVPAAEIEVAGDAISGFAVEVYAADGASDAAAVESALEARGFEAWTVVERVGAQTRHRVCVGRSADEAGAAAFLAARGGELPDGAAVIALP